MWLHLHQALGAVKILETESRTVVARGWGQGTGEFVFDERRASVWEDEEFWGWMKALVVQHCECIRCH